MMTNYTININPPLSPLRSGYFESYKLFNFNIVEEYTDDDAYLVLYTYLAQTDLFIGGQLDPSQLLYQRLGNLPADSDMKLHIDAILTQRMDTTQRYVVSYSNGFPKTANYTFVHPLILYDNHISIYEKARYIRAVKNISLRRRLFGKKILLPKNYIDEDISGLVGITTNRTQVRFNLEEQIKLLKEI